MRGRRRVFFHIVAVVLLVAAVVVADVAFQAARGTRRPWEISLLPGLTHESGSRTWSTA